MRDPRQGRFTARAIAALAIGGNVQGALAFCAGQNWDNISVLRTAVGSMVDANPSLFHEIGRDLLPLVKHRSVLDRLPGLRKIPPYTRAITGTARPIGSFVGPGAAIPVGRSTFAATTLQPKKVGAILVTTRELLKVGGDSEIVLSDDLAEALGLATDVALLDAGAGDNARPASIANGAITIPSSGVSLAQIDADLGNAIDMLTNLGADLTSAAWVLSPISASFLTRLRGSGGAPAFPFITPIGGTLLGLPCLTSEACSHAGSPTSSRICLVDGSGVRVSDPAEVSIEISTSGTVEMLDAGLSGDAAAGTGANSVALLQTESVAVKAVRRIVWERSRPCVVVISGCAY